MDFGVFLPVANNGYIASLNAPVYDATWELNRDVTLTAERHGLDFVFSMSKWKGYGGETRHWDVTLESIALCGALAAVTSTIEVYGTVALPTIHPGVAAKMVATLADVSSGRFGLNIVAGWNKAEYTQFGLWPGDDYFGYRYEYAAEYVHVLRSIWTGERTNHQGRFFHIDDHLGLPAPRVTPKIVCAGQSDEGMRFCAAVGDYNFVNAADVATATQLVARTRHFAEEAGRELGTYALYTIIAEETDVAAEARAQHIREGADLDALRQLVAAAQSDPSGVSPAKLQAQAFMGFPTIIGSYERVAEQLAALRDEAGVAGVLFTWPDFVLGIEEFAQRIAPLLGETKVTS